MTYIVNVNEITVVQLVLLALFRRKPYVLAIDPLFPPARRLLQPIVDKLIASGRARWIIDLCPEFRSVWEYYARIYLHDIFAETEEWQNGYYGFASAEQAVPDYAFCYKHETCNFSKKMHFPFLLIHSALKSAPEGTVKVVGLLANSVAALEAYWGRDFRPMVNPMWVPRFLINFTTALFISAYSLIWILLRLRPLGPQPKEVFFAADYIEDKRDMRIYQEIADGGPVLLVVRGAKKSVGSFEECKTFLHCKATDGFFTLKNFLTTAGFVIKDGFRLFIHFNNLPPGLYYQVATLPYRKAVFRAFFNKYRPRYFWGRDDYNVEHILRREELHRVGGKSMGINHGYPSYCHRLPMWRYISFDLYYVFGLAVYQRYLKDTWAENMKVVPVGSFGATRDNYGECSPSTTNDVVIYCAVAVGNPQMVRFIRRLAESLTDRKVLLQIKVNFTKTESGRQFIEDCTKDLTNVELADAPLFDLFRQARYGFSDPSTVVVEGLQFGQISFFVDILEEHKTCIFREFPSLCVSSAEEAVDRIRSMESGDWQYPRETFGELIDLSGRVIFDVIRDDMGLPPKYAVNSDA